MTKEFYWDLFCETGARRRICSTGEMERPMVQKLTGARPADDRI